MGRPYTPEQRKGRVIYWICKDCFDKFTGKEDLCDCGRVKYNGWKYCGVCAKDKKVCNVCGTAKEVSKDGRTCSFSLSTEQLFKLDDFREGHECKLQDDSSTGRKKVGAIGGQYTYRFTPTSIGTVVIVKCACGAEIDLSDYEDW